MSFPVIFGTLLILSVIGYYMGRSRALGGVGGDSHRLHSRPHYYGYYVAIWCGLPTALMFGIWLAFESNIVTALLIEGLPAEQQTLDEAELGLLLNDIRNLARGDVTSRAVGPELTKAANHYNSLLRTSQWMLAAIVAALAVAGITFARTRISPALRARNFVERVMMSCLIVCSSIAILTTVGIVLSLLFESLLFFQKIAPVDFFFGLQWSPQTALREDQVAATGLFGAIPLLAGTLLISFIAMCVAAPVGLLAAIYMAEYASPRLRAWVKPSLEVLAGIPTVVYGFFAALTVAPFLRDTGASIGLDIASESALAAGAVMGIMIIPFVSSLSDDVISAVPQSLREGSYGLGATRSETIKQVILPAALPGIVGSLLLAVSRAIGETMIVVMAAGLSANLTANPFEAVTTVTVQIVTLLVGDQEFDSAKTLAAFALGLMLFCITLVLNIIALTVVNKYREQYD